ncbi:hypothetical protein CLOM_g14222 [Closterium sp. NIES-68]|nr:hypothetical protein CLOM_g14222 [Closterium sp. NIES-68]
MASVLQNGTLHPEHTTAAPRRQHNSLFATSSHNMAFQPHSSPTETLSSPANSGRTDVSARDQTRHVIRIPSADRRTDRAPQPNCEQLLRAACKDDISKWDLHLPVLEFAYNNATHTATGQTPFFLS